MVQTHYIKSSSDEDVIMSSFLAVSANEDANTVNSKDCAKCPNKVKKQIIEKFKNS